MPKSSSARSPEATTVHPLAPSRIERVARELDVIREEEAELRRRKEEISGRLVGLMHIEGKRGEDGKIRYSTDAHKFVLIKGKNTYTSKGKMVTALSSEGLTPRQIAKVTAACVTVTEYEYVGVYKAGAEGDEEGAA